MIGAEASIILALALLVTAIALNAGFFSAPGTPVPLGLAAAASAAAFVAVGSAMAELDAYFVCQGSPAACLRAYESLSNALLVLSTVLGLQAVAFAAAIIPALVPFLGAAPMAAIAATLTAQLLTIPAILALYVQFVECMNERADGWVIGLGFVIIAIIVGILIYGGPSIVKAGRNFHWPPR
jgi:hypothetical protein